MTRAKFMVLLNDLNNKVCYVYTMAKVFEQVSLLKFSFRAQTI